MTLTTQENRFGLSGAYQSSFHLTQGPQWNSFERFRTVGREGLISMQAGSVGTIVINTHQFRVLQEDDFQKMLGLARDVDRIRKGMRVVMAAARSVQLHKDATTIETLIEATMVLGEIPILPTQTGFDEFKLHQDETVVMPDDDEVDLNVVNARNRRYGNQAAG